MLADSFKRAKIIATLGPACSELAVIEDLIRAGANGFRLNFSHGTHDTHTQLIKRVRAASQRLDKPVAIIQDLQGPRLRLGELGRPTELQPGQEVVFSYAKAAGTLPVQYDISGFVKPGDPLLIKDGEITARITGVKPGRVSATIEGGGSVSDHQGINLPEADLAGAIITDKDERDIEFACGHDVDYIALSFVQQARDIDQLRRRLQQQKSDIAVIAKIETKAAVKNLDSIVAASDGVMVARGDLAVETTPEEVPVLQRRIIHLARRHQKLVIVATQMLESMIDHAQPTRAEVSDIAGAVLQGADALMLSAETAAGQRPVETVEMMKRVIRRTEDSVEKTAPGRMGDAPVKENAISAAAITLAYQVGAQVIIAETASGQTARNLSAFRPPMPIVMVTHNRRVHQKLALVWGGKSHLVERPEGAAAMAIKALKAAGNIASGDAIVVAAGHSPGLVGGTNRIEVQIV